MIRVINFEDLGGREPEGLSWAESRFFFGEVRGEENLWKQGTSYRLRMGRRFSRLEKMASGKITGE